MYRNLKNLHWVKFNERSKQGTNQQRNFHSIKEIHKQIDGIIAINWPSTPQTKQSLVLVLQVKQETSGQ